MTLHDQLIQANCLVTSGDMGGAVAEYQRLLADLLDRGAVGEYEIALMVEVADDLTQLLRWHQRYAEAIDLQTRLAHALPALASDFTLQAATLMIESGVVDEGLASMTTEAQTLDPVTRDLLLGNTYAWLGRPHDALLHLQRVCEAPLASVADRASACHMVFQIHGAQKEIPAAMAAWRAARALDGRDQDHLPDLLRMLIYWYQYDDAAALVPQLQSELQRSYFRTILESKSRALPTRHDWAWIHDYDQASLTADLEDYAEAALRSLAPELTLAVLLPRIEVGDVSRRRLLLAGLAFAQQRDVSRTQWALDQALRSADLERPRRTRPGVGGARIFDAETRILYGELAIDNDLRTLIDHYFMPKPRHS